jgi:hypothetical protein
MRLQRYLDRFTQAAALPETPFASPAVSGCVEVSVDRHRDGHAGLVSFLIASIALPVVPPGIKEGTRWHLDYGTGLFGRPITSIALPTTPV